MKEYLTKSGRRITTCFLLLAMTAGLLTAYKMAVAEELPVDVRRELTQLKLQRMQAAAKADNLGMQISARERGISALISAQEKGVPADTLEPRIMAARDALRKSQQEHVSVRDSIKTIDNKLSSPRFWTMEQRLAELESRLAGADGSTPELYHGLKDKKKPDGIQLLPGVTAGVLLEAEASLVNSDGESEYDIVLATFEFGIQAEPSPWLSCRTLLLWEEDCTEPVDFDEGVISLHMPNGPLYLEVGKMYVPFGVFNTHVVSDPLTLELAETRLSTVLVGYANDLADIRIGGFAGDIGDGGAVAAFTLTPVDSIEMGVYWTSDMRESGTLIGMMEECAETASSASTNMAPETLDDNPGTAVGGFGSYISVHLGRLLVDAEYVSSLESFDAGIIGDSELQPSAWNFELAYVPSELWELALRMEGSSDMPGLPESQFGGGVSRGLNPNASLKLEYLHGTFDGDDPDQDIFTVQLAVEF